jgi:hypothetical protein
MTPRLNPRRDVLLSLLAMAVLGVVAGVLWAQLADPVVATRTAEGVASGEGEVGKQVTADGWFTVIGLVGSALVALGLMLRRGADALVTLLALVAGSLVAAWICVQVGGLVGPAPAAETLAREAVGKTAEDQLSVHTWVAYLAWPFGVVVGSLVVLLGSRGSDRPSPSPVIQ